MARKQDFALFVAGRPGSFKGINKHLVVTMFDFPAYLCERVLCEKIALRLCRLVNILC